MSGEETRTSEHHDSPCNLLVQDTFLIGLLKVYYNTVHAAACPAIWYALPVLYNEEYHMRKREMNQR